MLLGLLELPWKANSEVRVTYVQYIPMGFMMIPVRYIIFTYIYH